MTINLLQCDTIMADHLNANEPYVLLLDYVRAYDKVLHETLIVKLPSFGISGKFLAWFANFLCNRRSLFRVTELCLLLSPLPLVWFMGQ